MLLAAAGAKRRPIAAGRGAADVILASVIARVGIVPAGPVAQLRVHVPGPLCGALGCIARGGRFVVQAGHFDGAAGTAHQAGEEAVDEGFEMRQGGADDADVAFDRGPDGGAEVVVLRVLSAVCFLHQ